MSSNKYASRNSVTSILDYKTTNTILVLASKAATIQEWRQDKESMTR